MMVAVVAERSAVWPDQLHTSINEYAPLVQLNESTELRDMTLKTEEYESTLPNDNVDRTEKPDATLRSDVNPSTAKAEKTLHNEKADHAE